MVFHRSLSDSKSPQVSRTLLSILAVLNNAVVWMFSTRPPTSKSSSPFSYPLVTVPNAPITIGIIVTCMFHSFFSSLARSRYLSFFSHSFSFILGSGGTAKSTILQVLFFFFLLIIIKSGLLAGIRWSVCILKSHRSLCESFSRTGAGLCIYHLLVWSNLNFLFRCMDVSTLSSMLASPLPPSFLDTYSLSASSLGCNALCIVISFLFLWSICLSSSRVHLRKGPEYLTRGTAQVFIPLMRFLLLSFV